MEIDDRAEKIGYKIRATQMERVPYMLIVGDSEVADGTASIRALKDGDIGAISIDNLVGKLEKELIEK